MIRDILISEQYGFCAYSERYIKNTDSVDIEHFDGRLKSSSQDSYRNWYGVLTYFNHNKPKKIKPFLPIIKPSFTGLKKRLKYENNMFIPVVTGDQKVINLIKYLGFNKHEISVDRGKHIKRIKTLYKLLNYDKEELLIHIAKDRAYLSFATAIEKELGINITKLIKKSA